MKKLTALFLALVMTLSLCTVTAFAEDYATVGDILANITNLPQTTSDISPDGAWKASTSNNTCYIYNDDDNMIAFNNGNSIFKLYSYIAVNKVDNKYTADVGETQGTDIVEFTMLDNKVVSITFSTTYSYKGTYYPPVVTHTVTIDDTIQNGKVTATPTDVASGTDVTVTTAPNAGYKTKSVSVTTDGGARVNVTGSGNAYSFVMPNEKVTVSAVFEKENSGTGGGHHHGGGSTTPTVSAPQTADGGIAIYGVLSVSSMIGMGWVSKKKK